MNTIFNSETTQNYSRTFTTNSKCGAVHTHSHTFRPACSHKIVATPCQNVVERMKTIHSGTKVATRVSWPSGTDKCHRQGTLQQMQYYRNLLLLTFNHVFCVDVRSCCPNPLSWGKWLGHMWIVEPQLPHIRVIITLMMTWICQPWSLGCSKKLFMSHDQWNS